MSDEETTAGVQLAKRVSNKNPLVSGEVPAVIQEAAAAGYAQAEDLNNL